MVRKLAGPATASDASSARGAIEALLRDLAMPAEPFLAGIRTSQIAKDLGKPVALLQASAFLELAVDLHRYLLKCECAASFEEVTSELLGPQIMRSCNIAGPNDTVVATRSGLTAVHLLSEHDPVFRSLSGNIPGQLVAYWAEIEGDEATRFVFHQSLEFFINLSSTSPVVFEYAHEIDGERVGMAALRHVTIKPRSFLLFDGRAPHRHRCRGPDKRAPCLVAQFSIGPAFTDPVAFVLRPPEDVPDQSEVPFSSGLAPEPPKLRDVLGPRLRGFRDAYGRTAEDISLLAQHEEARLFGGAQARKISPSGSARVRFAQIEGGERDLSTARLVSWAAALDAKLRDVVCFPDAIVLAEGELAKCDVGASLIPSDSYFVASSPAGLYDARILSVRGLADDEGDFFSAPGELLVLALDTPLEIALACSPLRFRRHAKPREPRRAFSVGFQSDISLRCGSVHLETIKPGQAAFLRGDLPHRIKATRDGLALLIGMKPLLNAHLATTPTSAATKDKRNRRSGENR